MTTKADKNKEVVKTMNENGIFVYEGVVVVCAKTGRIWCVEYHGEPNHAHATLDTNGEVSVFSYDNILRERVLH